MSITIYDPVTGDIVAVRSGSSFADLAALAGDQPFVDGSHSPLFYRVDLATGEVVAKPE